MAVFKCKMCGGTLQIENNETVAVCEYCGTKQTLPKLDDEKRANLYDRANHFRQNDEFDKAMSLYEQILSEDATDAEAYWSIVLCRYGIEYVEDPATHRRIPTVNRTQFTSILMDSDYKSAMQYGDAHQRSVYEEEAKAIDEIQKEILAVSQKEEPFDVFICYKENDNNGQRTPDSVLATELYHELTEEGLKVFFSRITLEDKIGSAYEPYIFAALHSARVMVVLGTKPEYFQAAWVRNEWSRYLALIKSGEKKMLIPAYKGMDPYDLPEEFSHLQAQDMSKLGFMQDLIRGVKKIAEAEVPAPERVDEEPVAVKSAGKVAPLLKRAFLFLEDRDFDSADEYCEKVLDLDPENAEAYLGKLMAEENVTKREELANCRYPFDDSSNYQKILRFADQPLLKEIKQYIANIYYNKAVALMNKAVTEQEFKEAAEQFQQMLGYKDVDQLAESCLVKAEEIRKEKTYSDARASIYDGKSMIIEKYEAAIRAYATIIDWKDAREQINICQRRIEELKIKKVRAKKRRLIIGVCIAIAVIIIIVVNILTAGGRYEKAVQLMENEQYGEAIKVFTDLGDYEDSAERLEMCQFYEAKVLFREGKTREAKKMLDEIDDTQNEELLKEIEILKQKSSLLKLEVGELFIFGTYEQDGNLGDGGEDIKWYVLAKEEGKILVMSKYALDCRTYHTEEEAVNWETCSLREWLNGSFYEEAFDSIQKDVIVPYRTVEGKTITDNVFALSSDEYVQYTENENAGCKPTAYAEKKGAYVLEAEELKDDYCCFWLRVPSDNTSQETCIAYMKQVTVDVPVNAPFIGVRPAMWLSTEI